tara:strand:+ start:129587 stop:131128 length:1542 start_codon:yes stop_codon:yes gene_type:complete
MTSLSNSVLWERMHEYYDKLGPEVWEEEVVPLQITSNTYLANCYAKIIIAQINDYINQHGALSAEQPFYILEMGCGHGRFSYYLVKMLLEAFAIYRWPSEWLKYVMTDISEKNIQSWQEHSAFEKFFDNNCLDMAYYNAHSDKSLNLIRANKTIRAGELKTPVFVICNYVFDTLPQDAFQVIKGQLHELELNIKNDDSRRKKDLKDYFEKAAYEFKANPIDTQYYSEYPVLNDILKKYEDDFDNATFLMPIGAIQCIENIKTLTNGPVMILASDKGVTETDLFDEIEDPDITFHGSVSMMVNFDALNQYTDLKKGQSFAMGNRGADFQVSVHLYNADYTTPHTFYAFQNSLSTYSPQDLFDLAYRDDEPNKAFKKTEEILGLLNLSEWDPSIFYDYYPILLDKLENEEVTVDQEFTMRNGLERVWHIFFKLEKSQDIPFAIGSLMYHMDLPEQAIKYYKESLKHFGCDKETYFNMALAYQEMEDNQTSLQMTLKALELQPNYKDAKQLQKELA